MIKQCAAYLSLNISMVLYLISYIPQLRRNAKKNQLSNLSLHFHHLLMLSYITDLIYGFGLSMPWQYKTVSLVGTVLLLIQHKQLFALNSKNAYLIMSICAFCLLLVSSVLISLLFSQQIRFIFFITIGYIAQTANLLYAAPQIYRNFTSSKAVLSLSIGYLTLNFICMLCDNISAWLLHWPLPSKLGAMVLTVFFSILIYQWRSCKKYEAIKAQTV
jgi:uncharacterized protein with PQ loop repeat